MWPRGAGPSRMANAHLAAIREDMRREYCKAQFSMFPLSPWHAMANTCASPGDTMRQAPIISICKRQSHPSQFSTEYDIEDASMEMLIIGLRNVRIYRDLFWNLAMIDPFVVVSVFVLMAARPRMATMCFLVSTSSAVLVTYVFHHNYALAIWSGHESAIQYLDESAFFAGFAASALAFVFARLGFAITMRYWRRA